MTETKNLDKMKRIFLIALLFISGVQLHNLSYVKAHCEIPCGIFDDQLRINLLLEHVTTIEKSMNEIIELSKAGDKNYNQIVRWVVNKEEHANKIQELVSQYFLHQRVKMADPSDKVAYAKYVAQLTSLHAVLVYAMKAKQTTDLSNIKKMQDAIHSFEHNYFEGEHKH